MHSRGITTAAVVCRVVPALSICLCNFISALATSAGEETMRILNVARTQARKHRKLLPICLLDYYLKASKCSMCVSA